MNDHDAHSGDLPGEAADRADARTELDAFVGAQHDSRTRFVLCGLCAGVAVTLVEGS